MRILHTSDWHLGRSLHRADLLGHQAAYVDHLLEVVEAEEVDLVVVAGDVFDRALPPVDAVALADDTLARLAASRATVVISSGNHDSARRLGFGSRVMDAAGLHVRTRPEDVGRAVELADAHGPVVVHALPYLDPDAVRGAWGLTGRSHEVALDAAMTRVRADLAGRPGARSVVLAHAFVAGGRPSDSERDIAVGGISVVPTSVFDGVDHVALGHLHGAHTLTERIRYSGSPLAYSFSEAGHTKGSWLVDLAADGSSTATFVPAPVPRPLARIRGDLADLLADPDLAGHEGSWVEATLTDAGPRPAGAMERLRTRFPHALVLAFDAPASTGSRPRVVRPGRSAHDVTLDFVADVRGLGADDAEAALLASACDACAEDPTQDVPA
ncbi:exonuclease SbcCD subunit D [Nocardioides sp. CFH 31398]|uniref:exonuclease SbcCD subunit D n=1 Tax=Nocardioides sp. CFH 31398 TaxID=2919579 RepID=UPI001F05E090|nr:exonuclease SbcCD subunit D [Nocardioides sp. CFH 31398]MCH1866968.1 exonuclease SbcCD subunit D [Nocardioides sp. CFH 31398]